MSARWPRARPVLLSCDRRLPHRSVTLFGEAGPGANRTIKRIKLIEHKDALEHDAVEDLPDDLVLALQKLCAAFKLD